MLILRLNLLTPCPFHYVFYHLVRRGRWCDTYVQVLLRSYSRAWGMCETGWRWLTPRVARPTFQRGRLVGEFGDGVAGVTWRAKWEEKKEQCSWTLGGWRVWNFVDAALSINGHRSRLFWKPSTSFWDPTNIVYGFRVNKWNPYFLGSFFHQF